MKKCIPAMLLLAASAVAAPPDFKVSTELPGNPALNLGSASRVALIAGDGLGSAPAGRQIRSLIIDIPDTPTPEPATWLLMGGGLAGLALVSRRRRGR